MFLQIGWTPLFVASSYDHPAVVELLIEHGAQLDIKNNVTFVLLAKCLIIRSVNKCLLFSFQEGRTALSLASYRGCSDTVRILVQRGANTDVQDKVGY